MHPVHIITKFVSLIIIHSKKNSIQLQVIKLVN